MISNGPSHGTWMDCPFFLLTAIPACSKSVRNGSSHYNNKIVNTICRTNMKLVVVGIDLLACFGIRLCSSRFVSFLET